jgi:DNA-directed RNA polymerase sigma subunit (sigma70/sigma32)
MKTLRAQGETLHAIGERFALSAERVRQILNIKQE